MSARKSVEHRREMMRIYRARYNKSEKGRATFERWRVGIGHEIWLATQHRYKSSPLGQASRLAWGQSPKGKDGKRRWNITPRGVECRFRDVRRKQGLL